MNIEVDRTYCKCLDCGVVARLEPYPDNVRALLDPNDERHVDVAAFRKEHRCAPRDIAALEAKNGAGD